jgi:hypothetical protein
MKNMVQIDFYNPTSVDDDFPPQIILNSVDGKGFKKITLIQNDSISLSIPLPFIFLTNKFLNIKTLKIIIEYK